VRRPLALWVDVAVKAALIGLLLLAVLVPDLPQFEGTLGDLTLGLSGFVVAALLAAWLWPRLRTDLTGPP
jgi:preprotein translocase subunit SecD